MSASLEVESTFVADQAFDEFLLFLAHDIVVHPERLVPIDNGLMARVLSLPGGIEIDLHAAR